MRKYSHGGDKYGFSNFNSTDENKNFEKDIMDFSANTNPLGMAEPVKKAAIEAIEKSDVYPDPFCRELIEKICEFESYVSGILVPNSWVVCGNGAADLIFRSIRAANMKKALVLAPTFSEYENALREENVQVSYFYLKKENDFSLTEDFLMVLDDEIDGLFLCNPNNPVGNLIEKDLLTKILKKAKEKKILIFVDECFLELTGEMEERSLVSQLNEYDNLVIFKAFTKTYAMAGLRLGYILTSNLILAEEIFNVGQPWSVSTPAQMAGIVALAQREYVLKSINYIKDERQCLQQDLEELGFKVYYGRANYIFFYDKDGKKFMKEMKKRGILIRDCENYHGLCAGYMRIAVKNRQENKSFVENAKEVLKWLKV